MLEAGIKKGPKIYNPKTHKTGTKLDQKSKTILNAYCEQEMISGAEAVRRGVAKLEPDLKKEESCSSRLKQNATSPADMPESRCCINSISCADHSFQALPDRQRKRNDIMVIRQLKEKQYQSLHNALMMKAQAQPLETSYTVNIIINGAEYAVKVQPQRHNKMAILQALRVYREEYGPNFALITKGNLLSSLLEILIYLGVE